jgi:hypothetical protein
MKKLAFVALLLLNCLIAFAQTGLVKGIIVDSKTAKPVADALVNFLDAKIVTATNASGEFSVSNLKYGTYIVEISADGYTDLTTNVDVSAKINNAGKIELEHVEAANNSNENVTQQASVTDDANDDDNSSSNSQNIGSVLNASRDAFISASTFSWGNYFYRLRGYEQDNSLVYINGILMNDLEEGNSGFSTYAGLNDVFRGRSTSLGLNYNEVGFGGLGMTTTIDASAATQRKQTRVTYSNTNRSYRHRLMATHSSGLNKNGWAYSFSGSKRWANEGPVAGTFYDAYSYYAAVEKRTGKHNIALTAFGAPTKRGRATPVIQESYDLAGTNLYNPTWGYQEGKKRNSRVLDSHVPTIMISDEIRISGKSLLNLAAAYQTGRIKNSSIDFYNTDNPRPDYYRYLPSYYLYENAPGLIEQYQQFYANNPNALQMDWTKFYNSNQNIDNFNGFTGKRSAYILSNDVEENKRFSIAANYQKVIDDHFTIYAGANFQNQKNENYRQVADLLGGEFFTNLNQFGGFNFPTNPDANQYDLNNPNQVVKEGDKYSYNYKTNFRRSNVYGQLVSTFNKIDFFINLNIGNTAYSREGLYKSGIFQNNSFGKSSIVNRTNLASKGGLTYKINGRNYLYCNGALATRAPYFDNVFISARTRNEVASIIKDEAVSSIEGGYILRNPKFKGRVGFYATEINNAMDIKRYFDDVNLSLVNLLMTNIDKRYTGLEMGFDFKASPTLSLNFASSISQAFYTNRPSIQLYIDNNVTADYQTSTGKTDVAYIQNYYLAAGPQTAATLGLNYRSPKFWFASLSASYFARNYMDFAPNVRTPEVIGLVRDNWGQATYENLLAQKQLNNAFVMDFSFGKSWMARKIIKIAPYRSTINMNLGVNNLLNNKNVQLLGFEQLRFDQNRPELFGPKYLYAIGAQYFVNLAYTF